MLRRPQTIQSEDPKTREPPLPTPTRPPPLAEGRVQTKVSPRDGTCAGPGGGRRIPGVQPNTPIHGPRRAAGAQRSGSGEPGSQPASQRASAPPAAPAAPGSAPQLHSAPRPALVLGLPGARPCSGTRPLARAEPERHPLVNTQSGLRSTWACLY